MHGRTGRSMRGGGVLMAEPQREREGGDSFLATADSIEQQYRTAFCALKYTRSSYKLAIYMDSGLSFDASLKVYGGEDLALAVGSGKLKGGRGSVFGEGVKRAGSHRERDGGNSVPATTDSISQQHRTAFLELRNIDNNNNNNNNRRGGGGARLEGVCPRRELRVGVFEKKK